MKTKLKHISWVSLIIIGITLVGCGEEPEVIRSTFEPPPRKIALALDNSGSMNQYDPQRMMLFSALVFTDLLEDRDFLYLTTFPGRDVIPSTKIGESKISEKARKWISTDKDRIRPADKSAAKRWIKDIAYESQITIFVEPSLRMIQDLTAEDGSPYSPKTLVFFSDGITDRGHNISNQDDPVARQAHEKEKDTLRKEVIPKFENHRITLYGITLGAQTVSDHFQEMADATHGKAVTANTQEDLVNKFAEIFSEILETKVEKMTFQREKAVSFKVNKYVKELILLFPDVKGDLDFRFIEPREKWWQIWKSKNEVHTESAAKSAVDLKRRFASTADELNSQMKYTVFRIQDPMPGDWKIVLQSYPAAQVECLAIQNYNVYLEVLGKGRRVGMVGEPNTFTGRLVTEDGTIIKDKEFYGEGNFHYEIGIGDETKAISPEEDYSMFYEYVPEDTTERTIRLSARNDIWFKRDVYLAFVAYRDIYLKHNGDLKFGRIVPYTDYFLERIWGPIVDGLWESGNHWKSSGIEVDFSGSAENAVGVKFKIDNDEIYDKYGVRLINSRGEEAFFVDDRFRQKLYLDVKRSAASNHIQNFAVPISTFSGYEVRGNNSFTVSSQIDGLSTFAWRYFIPLELLLYIWLILFLVGKPFLFLQNSFTADARVDAGYYEIFRKKRKERRTLGRRIKSPFRRFILFRVLLSYLAFILLPDYWRNILSNESNELYLESGPKKWVRAVLGIFLPTRFCESIKLRGFEFYKFQGRIYCSKKLRDYFDKKPGATRIKDERYQKFKTERSKALVPYSGNLVDFVYIKDDVSYQIYLNEK